tara:strand:- start:1692 stop:3413 length:1722 start_codon:yes stop_codon:yes gene_type:complete
MGGFKTTQKYLQELSRGFSTFTQMNYVYCHSGGNTTLDRFTLDATGNSSIVTDRTPTLQSAYGTVSLSGASGSVDMISVNGVDAMSGSVPFNTDINQTATDVASNITAYNGTPNYTATANGSVVTITSATGGGAVNGYAITNVLTTLTSTIVNMNYGSDALINSTYNLWMFDVQYDSSTSQNYLISHVAPNLDCICNDRDGQIFFGEVLGTGILQSIALPTGANATGGVVSLHPYLFYYGTDGVIGWSKPGEPTDLSGTGSGLARVWGQKIIKGLPMRAGSGTAPAGLFWAFDAVLRATFTGGTTVFQFDVIATGTSIMSPQCVVDYDGVFYWAGVDRFYMFNGVVREVPNTMNLNYFFDEINTNHQTKCFGFQIPKYGEIWWCYPKGSATECTHAVVFNVRENTWYDTELPNNGRSAGHFNNSFAAPILTGVESSSGPGGSGYKVWQHEFKVDEYDGPTISPIKSFFETADLSTLVTGDNRYLRITTIEPDFVQTGDMTVKVTGRANARAPEVVGTTFTFPAEATEPYQQIVMLKEQRRELRVRFESNALYGDYQMGQIIAHLDNGDGTDLG